jgi:hypothetical protein
MSTDGNRRYHCITAYFSGDLTRKATLSDGFRRYNGAGCRSRTRDPRFTKPLLYQLS